MTDCLIIKYNDKNFPSYVETIHASGVDNGAYHNLNLAFVTLEGKALSGGVRQRVALARALLMRPGVLIIDESTSQLDIATELAVLRRIKAELGSTLILVSHRLTSPDWADRIFSV
jgi:ABC-type bacteriocin/lantibiotic exporter with double-glycine peptidase domain